MDTRDMSQTRLLTENEIDNAIYAVLCAAFCEDEEEELRRVVRLRLPAEPTPLQIVDAICAELRWRGGAPVEGERPQEGGPRGAPLPPLAPTESETNLLFGGGLPGPAA